MAERRAGRRADIARTSFTIGSVAAALASIVAAPDARGVLGAGLALAMGAIAFYDSRHFLIPNALNAVALVLALAHAVVLEPEAAAAQVAFALARGAITGGV